MYSAASASRQSVQASERRAVNARNDRIVEEWMSRFCLCDVGPTKFLYVLVAAQVGQDAPHFGGETEDLSTAAVTVCSAARILTMS